MGIYPDKTNAGNLTGKYRVELQLKGQRVRGRFDTLAEAQAMELKWRKQLVTQKTQVPTLPRSKDTRNVPQTLGDLFDHASRSLWKNQVTETQTYQRAQGAIGILGADRSLRSLNALDIDALATELSYDKSPATVNRYLSALHTVLVYGKRMKWLAEVPEFPWQQEAEGRIRWITETEEHRLLEALGSPSVADVVRVAIATGMRRNELLELTLRDVEPNWIRLWETKNKTPRSIPITDTTYALVTNLLRTQNMPSQHQLRYYWDEAKAKIGLKDDPLFVFHATRHTCATRLVRANVNIRVIQRWLGHKRIETTLRYAHVNDEMLTGALDKLSPHKDIRRVLPSPATLDTQDWGTTDTNVEYVNPLLTGNKPAITGPLARAGVVKLADTQDLGSQPDPDKVYNS